MAKKSPSDSAVSVETTAGVSPPDQFARMMSDAEKNFTTFADWLNGEGLAHEQNPERRRLFKLYAGLWAATAIMLQRACTAPPGGDIESVPLDASAVNAATATVWKTWESKRLL